MEDEATKQRAIGKLVKEVMMLDSGLRALAAERDNKIDEINEDYRRKLREKRRQIAEVMKRIQKMKRAAEVGEQDEELTLGQAALGEHIGNLGVGAEVICLMHEIREEMGLGKASYAALARVIDDCLYEVPDECSHCMGGGGV